MHDAAGRAGAGGRRAGHAPTYSCRTGRWIVRSPVARRAWNLRPPPPRRLPLPFLPASHRQPHGLKGNPSNASGRGRLYDVLEPGSFDRPHSAQTSYKGTVLLCSLSYAGSPCGSVRVSAAQSFEGGTGRGFAHATSVGAPQSPAIIRRPHPRPAIACS